MHAFYVPCMCRQGLVVYCCDANGGFIYEWTCISYLKRTKEVVKIYVIYNVHINIKLRLTREEEMIIIILERPRPLLLTI